MTIDLAPTRVSPKYAPTVTAEQLGRQLAQLLTVIAERFATKRTEALAALEAGDTFPAEQLCSDEEHIAEMVSAVVDRFVTDRKDRMHASDGVGALIGNLTGVLDLDATLEATPERQARYRAWSIARGVDPDTDEIVDDERFRAYLKR